MAEQGFPPPKLSPDEHEEFESSRDLPQKNRKAFNKSTQNVSEELVQVETKPGLAWTESEQKIREPRVRQSPPTAVDTGPSVQVETNSGHGFPTQAENIAPPNSAPVDTVPLTGEPFTTMSPEEERIIQEDLERNADPVVISDSGKVKEDAAVLKTVMDLFGESRSDDKIEPFVGPIQPEQPIKPPKERGFHEDGSEYVDSIDLPPKVDSRAEEKSLLKRLLENAKGTLYDVKEKFDWYKNSKEGLIRSNSELDTKVENVKGLEKIFRKFGENYNKMGWKSKLVIGTGLGLGAGLSGAAVSGIGILGFTTLIVAQRTAALATMYLKYEKKTSPAGEKREVDASWWHIGAKEKAFLKAALYTAAMTAGTAEAVKEIRESTLAQDVNEWLGHMMEKVADKIAGTTYHSEAGAVATAPSIFKGTVPLTDTGSSIEQLQPEIAVAQGNVTPEAPQPAAAAAASEQVSRPITQDIPRSETPSSFEMPKHADFSIHEDDTEISPYDVTPTGNKYVDDALSVEENGQAVTAGSTEPAAETTRSMPAPPEAPADTPEPAIESVKPAIDEPLPNVKVPEPEKYATVDLTQQGPEAVPSAPEAVAMPEPAPVETPTIESPSTPVEAPAPTIEPPAQTAEPSVSSSETKIETSVNFKVNAHGLSVDIAHADSYLDFQGNKVIFGGSLDDRVEIAKAIVAKDHSAIVYFDSTRPSGLFGLLKEHHISKAFFFSGAASEITPAGPGGDINISQPLIVDDTIDPSLKGWRLPSIDDLKEVYKTSINRQ